MRFQVTATAVAAFSVCALAQSFNLDLGDRAGVPSAWYGGAAASPGFWNMFPGNSTNPLVLRGLDGTLSGVVFSQSIPFGQANSSAPGLIGDDEAMLGDYFDLHSTPHTWAVTGLQPGDYSVYTYAIGLDDPRFRTVVVVNDDPNQAQFVGGEWTGAMELGTTHARHDVHLAPSQTLTIFMRGVAVLGPTRGTFNGVQIVANALGVTMAPADALPEVVAPDTAHLIAVDVDQHDDTLVSAPSIFTSVDGGPVVESAMTHDGGVRWIATLPSAPCGSRVTYYFSCEGVATGLQTLPLAGPEAEQFSVRVGYSDTRTLLRESFESGLPSGWAADGFWHVSGGCAIEPPCDGTQFAYYGQEDRCDYDNDSANSGTLTLPPVDLSAYPPTSIITLRFCQFLETEGDFGADSPDVLVNGEVVFRALNSSVWMGQSIDLSPYAGQVVSIAFRFDTQDLGGNAYRGWQVDDVTIGATRISCTPPCVGDISGDGQIDLSDLASLLAEFGNDVGPTSATDLNGDGRVDLTDLALLLRVFGSVC